MAILKKITMIEVKNILGIKSPELRKRLQDKQGKKKLVKSVSKKMVCFAFKDRIHLKILQIPLLIWFNICILVEIQK